MTRTRMTPAQRRRLHARRALLSIWHTLPAALAALGGMAAFFALCVLILETI